MIYKTAQDWRQSDQKKVLLFGMSGLGKTHVSNMLRASGNWFHYSIDYRIGTRYLGESIVDNLKREAMKNDFLASLLKTDSIHIGSNISFENLDPLSTFLGKPGDPAKGGIEFGEYQRRQLLHEQAEIAALQDTAHFVQRARDIYQYDHFVCDSGGSICEVVDPEDQNDPVLKLLAETVLMVWIEGLAEHDADLVKRFDAAPKPMCYRAEFLNKSWDNYLRKNNVVPAKVDPDNFVRSTYAKAISMRHPRYRAMAQNWGVTVSASEISRVTSPQLFDAMIERALEMRSA